MKLAQESEKLHQIRLLMAEENESWQKHSRSQYD